MTFAEAVERMKQGAMIRQRGMPLWSWRGKRGRCYYGPNRKTPLQIRDTFLCSEVFADDWETKGEGGAE